MDNGKKGRKVTVWTPSDRYHKKDISCVILIVTKRSALFVHRVREAISKFKPKCS